jgi:nucleoside-diphosphate-sugar epimerase
MARLVAFSSTSRFTKARSPDPAERAVAARLAEGEARVEAFCADAGVAWTVLRPTLIYAEGLDRNVSRLAGLARRFGVLPLSGRGQGLRQPVHADDLAVAAVEALGREAAFGRAYDLPGGETLSYRAMAERVFAGLGRTPRILSVPKPVWRAGLAVAAPLLPGVGAAMGERMDQDLAFDGAAAARDLGWSPRPFQPRFDEA